MSDGLHKELLNRICTNLAELNRQLDRHDLNQQLQHAEAIHAHENQEQYQRGQRSRFQMIEEQMMICQGMVGDLMAARQPMIKFNYEGNPQWVSRADIVRAYTTTETRFESSNRVMTPARFFLITRDLDATENGGSDSHYYKFNLDDPDAQRIMAFLDHMCLNLNSGDTQPL